MPRQGDEPVPGYRLQRRLGRGSFGEVWQASGPGGTSAALKFIGLGDNQALREFRAIQRIKQIRHVHLMPLIGIWLIDQHENLLDEQFLAQWATAPPAAAAHESRNTLKLPTDADRRPVELIEAMPLGDQDLSGRLDDCRAAGLTGIPVDELLDYLQDAAKAIDFLNAPRHDLGDGLIAIHHGDIKPQNIMLVGGAAQVCDFGLARILGGLQATSTALAGSPAYMAPESIRDKRPHRSTDQYSLAITYAELRTGGLPFHSQSYLEVLNAHLEGTLNLDALPPAERAVIERGTALDPEQRFESSLALVHALQQAVAASEPASSALGSRAAPLPLADLPASVSPASPRGTLVPDSLIADDGLSAGLPNSPLTSTPRSSVADTEPTPGRQHPPATFSPPLRRRIPALLSVLAIAGLLAGGWWWWSVTPSGSPRPPLQAPAEASVAGTIPASLPPAAAAPIANRAPQVEIASSEPSEPRAGQPLVLALRGDDPEQDELRYEYRTNPAGDWQQADGGKLRLESVAPGELVLEFRAVDSQGLASPIVERRWLVPKPIPPTVEISAAPERLQAGDTLRVQLTGADPAGVPLSYEWRTADDQTWQPAADGAVEIADLATGELLLEVRALDRAGLASAPLRRSWMVTLPEEITNSLGMTLRLIPAGEFLMGSDETSAEVQEAFGFDDEDRVEPWTNFDDEQPRHRVRISQPFYLATHEVTRAQFAQFVDDTGYQTDAERDGQGGGGWDEARGQLRQRASNNWRTWGVDQQDDSPVVNVTWFDAVKFCEWLSKRDGKTYRLPSEAEWEYACRAGTNTRFSSGDDPESLAEVGNVLDAKASVRLPSLKYGIQANDGWEFDAPVGSFRANPWGLFDLHGNVWEWCGDWYDAQYYAESPAGDPTGPAEGTARIVRGGGWGPYPVFCRAAYRGWEAPSYRECFVGFRVVRTP